MLSVYLLLACAGMSHAVNVDDFDIHMNTYELLYHASTHLLVAIDYRHCYYVNVPEGKEGNLVNDHWTPSRLQRTEYSLIEHISQHHSVTPTTLDAVRDKYGDLLADFHCIDKYIYEVDIFSTNGGTGQQTTHFSCLGHPDGYYVYLGDCRKFLWCFQSGSMSVVADCAEGTYFDPKERRCLAGHVC